MNVNNKIKALRKIMAEQKIDAYIIPGTDFHFGEYLADYYKTREWVSGFDGSAGTVVVTANKAGLWTDFRYYIAAEQVLKGTDIELHRFGAPGVLNYPEWLGKELESKTRIAFDGRQLSLREQRNLESHCYSKEISLIPDVDLINEIWEDRPSLPNPEVFVHNKEYSSVSIGEKFQALENRMTKIGCDTLILSTLDDIAWLTNLRGADIPFNPVFLSYMIITRDARTLYIDSNKITDDIAGILKEQNIRTAPYDSIIEGVKSIPQDATIIIDADQTNALFYNVLPDSVRIIEGQNPVASLKAIKTMEEIHNTSDAMVQDGIALVRFWRWLETAHKAGEPIDEHFAGVMLRRFRSEQENFIDESFSPIIGFNGNGAIVHYSASEDLASEITGPGVLLVDSGGQYLNGTTDITRVFNLGSTDPDIKRDYTLVLKGHLALSDAVFPQGTCGYQLDILARQPLWNYGMNFGHGTGHGVGYFLCVHEGPQRISPHPNTTVLEPGMICSNEPGVYKEKKYGIRIENLIAVQKKTENEFGVFNHFETLTLFPYDISLIDVDLLTEDEKQHINSYHENVIKALSPHVGIEELEWLRSKCRAL